MQCVNKLINPEEPELKLYQSIYLPADLAENQRFFFVFSGQCAQSPGATFF